MGSPVTVPTEDGYILVWPSDARAVRVRYQVEGETRWLTQMTQSVSITNLFQAIIGMITWTQLASDFCIGTVVGALSDKLALPAPFRAFLVTAAQAKALALPGGGIWTAFRVGEVAYWFFRS